MRVRVPVDRALPVGVREGPVRVPGSPPQQAHQRGQVVLVDEALLPAHAEVAERLEAGVLGDGLEREGPVHLEPLRALAPLGQADVAAREEGPVPGPAAAVLVAVHEAGGGARQERVHGREVVDRDARLREEREPLVAQVQQRVREEPTLRFHQARVAPFRPLHASSEHGAEHKHNIPLRAATCEANYGTEHSKRYLAWDHAAVEHGVRRRRPGVGGMGVHVDGVEPLVPSEEFLPQGTQRQLSSHQEQEGNLGHAAFRRATDLGDQRRSPEQLLVGHVVHHAVRREEINQLRLRLLLRRRRGRR
ncbi:hypothetical protein PR202_gb26541 [Eleusine coracana subsp. coracana]|uniref:Uncharacterized protein n=1 Tax=Eleusine coracana subsp. coracana TaxID=191504 RepID=A0AAV5FSW1_ELECO|nr:hypothetical protein PR202_gb26541 [Eleusine coracana subsp. coracana]